MGKYNFYFTNINDMLLIRILILLNIFLIHCTKEPETVNLNRGQEYIKELSKKTGKEVKTDTITIYFYL